MADKKPAATAAAAAPAPAAKAPASKKQAVAAANGSSKPVAAAASKKAAPKQQQQQLAAKKAAAAPAKGKGKAAAPPSDEDEDDDEDYGEDLSGLDSDGEEPELDEAAFPASHGLAADSDDEDGEARDESDEDAQDDGSMRNADDLDMDEDDEEEEEEAPPAKKGKQTAATKAAAAKPAKPTAKPAAKAAPAPAQKKPAEKLGMFSLAKKGAKPVEQEDDDDEEEQAPAPNKGSKAALAAPAAAAAAAKGKKGAAAAAAPSKKSAMFDEDDDDDQEDGSDEEDEGDDEDEENDDQATVSGYLSQLIDRFRHLFSAAPAAAASSKPSKAAAAAAAAAAKGKKGAAAAAAAATAAASSSGNGAKENSELESMRKRMAALEAELESAQTKLSAMTATAAAVSAPFALPAVGDSRIRVAAAESFWHALCEGAVQRTAIDGEDDATGAHWLALTDPAVCWLDEEGLGQHLYVRRCYRQLYSMLEQLWQSNKWVLLLGSPGIGKSMFRFYLLYRLCEKHVRAAVPSAFTVVLQNATDMRFDTGACELLCFQPATAVSAAAVTCELSDSFRLPSAWKQLLRYPPPHVSMYYICDSLSPDVAGLKRAKVRVLEVSSPQEARWKPFRTGVSGLFVEQRYMPLVALREMQHMREHVPLTGSKLSAKEVQERYRILGGSVRGVLVNSCVTAESILASALLHAKSLDAVLSSSSMSGDLEGSGLDHVPSTLVHFRVSEEEQATGALVTDEAVPVAPAPRIAVPFSAYEPVFASNYIRQAIHSKFVSTFTSMLGEMVRSANMPFTSVLQGNLYEQFVHTRVQNPPANPCPSRRLDGKAAAVPLFEEMSKLKCVEFDDVSELAELNLQAGHYYKPISKSFGAVDFVLGTNVVGNMTLNLRHGLSLTALLRVVRAMRIKPAGKRNPVPILRFLWLLPTRDLFERMHAQPLEYKGRVVSESSGDAAELVTELKSLVQLQQFAVLMEPVLTAQPDTAPALASASSSAASSSLVG